MASWESTRAETVDWYTPQWILHPLGAFDLDPCFPLTPLWDIATHHYTIEDDGLKQEWPKEWRVWCNPPYGNLAGKFMEKLANHGNGIALLFFRAETKWFFDTVWDRADGVFVFKGRVHFHRPDGTLGNSPSPSCLVAYGANNLDCIGAAKFKGKLLVL